MALNGSAPGTEPALSAACLERLRETLDAAPTLCLSTRQLPVNAGVFTGDWQNNWCARSRRLTISWSRGPALMLMISRITMPMIVEVTDWPLVRLRSGAPCRRTTPMS